MTDSNVVEVVGVLIESLAPGIPPLFGPDDGLALLSILPDSAADLSALGGRVVRLSGQFGSGPETLDFFAFEPTRNVFEFSEVSVEGVRVPQRTIYSARTGLGADAESTVLNSEASVRAFADELHLDPVPNTESIEWGSEFVVAITGTRGLSDLLPVMSFIDADGRMRLLARELLIAPTRSAVGRDIVLVALPRSAGVIPEISLTLNSLAYPAAPTARTALLRKVAEQALAR